MNNSVFKALEKVFGAEIEGRIFQSKASIYHHLESNGYVSEVRSELPAAPFIVKGWGLTEFGRYEFCRHCDEKGGSMKKTKKPVKKTKGKK